MKFPNLSIAINPAIRLLAGILITVFLLLSFNPYRSLICATLILVLICIVFGIDRKYIGFLLFIFLTATLTFISALLYAKPSGFAWAEFQLFNITFAQITEGSLALSFALFLRMVALGVAAILTFYRTDFTSLADACVQLLHIPQKLVFSVFAGIRTCFLVSQDFRNIRYACSARQVPFLLGGVTPLFVSALRRAYRLSLVLKLRGITVQPKAHARIAAIGIGDIFFLSVCCWIIVVTQTLSEIFPWIR